MTTARRKRLEKLEQTSQARRGPAFGALVLPPIEYDLNKWSADAQASQQALANATRTDADQPAQVRQS